MKKILFAVVVMLTTCSAIIGQTTKVIGTVYDATGAVIVGAVVTAVDSNKTVFRARAGDSGEYELTLPFKKYSPSSTDFKISEYQITATAEHFQNSVVPNFRVVPAYSGSLGLDFGLDAIGVDPCHDPTACVTPVLIDKSKETGTPERISSRPNAEVNNKTNKKPR